MTTSTAPRTRPPTRALLGVFSPRRVGCVAMLITLGCDGANEPRPIEQPAQQAAAAAAEPAPAVIVPPAKPEVAPEPVVAPPEVTPAVPPVTASARTEDERNTTAIFKAAAPATVFVTQSQVVFDRFSMRAAEVPAGTGTGFIWDAEGHIVTNCHVALPDCRPPTSGKPKLKVSLYDHKEYPAELVGFDPAKDIAVLKIDAPKASMVPLRRPPTGYELEVGQKTLAIGNPFGLDHTLTVGVVSALGREVKGVGGLTIRGMVQTDAAINPGNSGGPLLDSGGQLIGMNTMIFSASGSSAGIGFAVPFGTIMRLVPQLIRSGRPERVGLGVSIFTDAQARRLGATGVVIRKVTAGSPADKAGLRSMKETTSGVDFDVIVGIGEERIKNYDDLYGAFEGQEDGDTVEVMIERHPGKKVEVVEVELARLD